MLTNATAALRSACCAIVELVCDTAWLVYRPARGQGKPWHWHTRYDARNIVGPRPCWRRNIDTCGMGRRHATAPADGRFGDGTVASMGRENVGEPDELRKPGSQLLTCSAKEGRRPGDTVLHD